MRFASLSLYLVLAFIAHDDKLILWSSPDIANARARAKKTLIARYRVVSRILFFVVLVFCFFFSLLIHIACVRNVICVFNVRYIADKGNIIHE